MTVCCPGGSGCSLSTRLSSKFSSCPTAPCIPQALENAPLSPYDFCSLRVVCTTLPLTQCSVLKPSPGFWWRKFSPYHFFHKKIWYRLGSQLHERSCSCRDSQPWFQSLSESFSIGDHWVCSYIFLRCYFLPLFKFNRYLLPLKLEPVLWNLMSHFTSKGLHFYDTGARLTCLLNLLAIIRAIFGFTKGIKKEKDIEAAQPLFPKTTG